VFCCLAVSDTMRAAQQLLEDAKSNLERVNSEMAATDHEHDASIAGGYGIRDTFCACDCTYLPDV
jgi:hypothetical protein